MHISFRKINFIGAIGYMYENIFTPKISKYTVSKVSRDGNAKKYTNKGREKLSLQK